VCASVTTIASMHTICWFRKGLRLHDNPALLAACEGASRVFPVFILDPHFLKPQHVGGTRLRFLLQSLTDLDASLRARDSRLIVLHGARRPPSRLASRVGKSMLPLWWLTFAVWLAALFGPTRAGKPEEVLPAALQAWGVKRLCFEWCVQQRVCWLAPETTVAPRT
jgi:DNA photolyase